MQEIARLFGSLGFKVDTTGLDTFRQNIKLARTDIANLGRDAKTSSNSLNALSRNITNVSNKLDKVSVKKANDVLTNSYTNVSKSVGKVDTAFLSISNNQKNITKALGKIHASVKAGEPIWDKYRASVIATRDALSQVNGKMKELRKNSTVSLRTTGVGGGRSTSGYNRNTKNEFSEGIRDFFRSMTPATLLTGGLASAGFLTKEIVNRGRAQQKMENVLLFSSKNLQDFNDSLKFVKKTADELGTSSKDLGTAFAQINMSSGDKLTKDEKKVMFKDMATSFAVMGATKDEQGLLYKAVNQMFSLGRIQAEEMNQLTGQGLVPREIVYKAIKEFYGLKTNEEVQKMQKDNKLDPIVLQKVFANMAKQAKDTGALDKYKESSLYQQNRLNNKMDEWSAKIMGGGLDQALGKTIKALLDLTEVIENATVAIKGLKDGLSEVTGGNSLLAIGLLILLSRYRHIARVIGIVIKAFKGKRKGMRVVQTLMTGTFGKAIFSIVGRFFWWVTAITAVTKGLSAIGAEMKKRNNGEWNWIDKLKYKFEDAMLDMKIAWLELQLAITNGKQLFRFALDGQGSTKINADDYSHEHETPANEVPTGLKGVKKLIGDIMLKMATYGTPKYPNYGSYNYNPSEQRKLEVVLPVNFNIDGVTHKQEYAISALLPT